MKLYRPARPSPRPFLAAPRRSRAATAAPIAATRSAAAENKERSSSGDNEKKTTGPVVAEAKMPPSALLSPEAKNTVALLRSLGTGDVVHTGGETFLSHLVGVYRVLKSWGCPEPLCLAGLAHSIYSTEGFQGFSLECTAASRARVANALGSLEAERVAHVFCCTDRGSQDRDLFLSEEEEEEGGRAGKRREREHRWRVRKGAPLAAAPVAAAAAAPSSSSSSSTSSPPQLFVPGEGPEDPYPDGTITLSHGDWLQYTTLTLADWMEQVESAALKESTHFGYGRSWRRPSSFRFFFFFWLARLFTHSSSLSKKKSKINSWGIGQAWGYRRRAFAAMARAVGGPGAQMHAEVMAREPEGASRAYEWPGWEEEEGEE